MLTLFQGYRGNRRCRACRRNPANNALEESEHVGKVVNLVDDTLREQKKDAIIAAHEKADATDMMGCRARMFKEGANCAGLTVTSLLVSEVHFLRSSKPWPPIARRRWQKATSKVPIIPLLSIRQTSRRTRRI